MRKSIICLGLLFLILPIRLLGYLDPGSGSYVFQILISVALGSLFAIKVFWKNLKNFFRGLVKKK